MSQIVQPYCSLPLTAGSRCIRVLEVDNSNGPNRFGDRIVGTLRVVNLDQGLAFTTLSYVWGLDRPDTKPTIVCSGVELKVTANCESALRHLRQKFRTLCIWIDAICIDQNNEAEKVDQLPLMGEIYSKSTATYVWLGNSTPQSDRAMEYLANAGFIEYFLPEVESSGEEFSHTARTAHPRAAAAFLSTLSLGSSRLPSPNQGKALNIRDSIIC